MNVSFCQRAGRGGLTLLEILAVVAIIGVIAAVAASQIFSSADGAKQNSCYVNKEEIAVQAQLWYRNKGDWPAEDLSDIGADAAYYPDGLPQCPVDGTDYTFDRNNQEVVGHTH